MTRTATARKPKKLSAEAILARIRAKTKARVRRHRAKKAKVS